MDTMPLNDSAGAARMSPPQALYAQVRAQIARTSPLVKPTRERLVRALIAVTLLVTTIVWAASKIVYGRFAVGLEVSAPYTLDVTFVLVSLVALTIVCTWVALWRGRGGLGASTLVLALTIAGSIPIYAGLIAVDPVHLHDDTQWLGISAWGTRCFAIATLTCTITLASFAAALRHAVPVLTGLRGGALGAAAGAWAGLALFVFCPSGEPGHLWVGHVLPVALFTLLGFVVLSRVLRP